MQSIFNRVFKSIPAKARKHLYCTSEATSFSSKRVAVCTYNEYHKYERRRYDTENEKFLKYSFFFGPLAFTLFKSGNNDSNVEKPVKAEMSETTSQQATPLLADVQRDDLPTYNAEEIMKHDSKDSMWVTFRRGVYDVTTFLPEHPGGDQIMNAAGLSIEPFWSVYGMHKTDAILATLELYRIGNLHEDDIQNFSEDDLWITEPYRDKRLLVQTKRPFNAEIPSKLQIQSLDTPNELFYVRSHMPVPSVKEDDFKLTLIIIGKTETMKIFYLNDLQKLPQVECRAALMCAGNRRSEMSQEVKPVKGINWRAGAVSNAVWTGVSLREMLVANGVDVNDVEGKHVIFVGMDIDAMGENFNTSIPLSLAIDPNAKILLATKMNREPLPRDHGYPLRVVVPGAAAVRSVKWLQSIIISEEESLSHWHKKDYRGFNPSKTWETADFSTAPPIYTLPVTSAICDPTNEETVKAVDGFIEAKGYAYSGGGNKILRVDVSANRGQTWIEAEPLAVDNAPARCHYSWYLWKAKLPVTGLCKEVELWVKATDSNFNTQPESFKDIWNIRGVLSNAYHKIKVKIDNRK